MDKNPDLEKGSTSNDSLRSQNRKKIEFIPLETSQEAKDYWKDVYEAPQKPPEKTRIEKIKEKGRDKFVSFLKKVEFGYYCKIKERYYRARGMKDEDRLFYVKELVADVWQWHAGNRRDDVSDRRAGSLAGHRFIGLGKWGKYRFGRFPDTGNFYGFTHENVVVKEEKSDKQHKEKEALVTKPEISLYTSETGDEKVPGRDRIRFGSKLRIVDSEEPSSDVIGTDDNPKQRRQVRFVGDKEVYWGAIDELKEINEAQCFKDPPEKIAEYARLLFEKAKDFRENNPENKDTYDYGGLSWDGCDSSGLVLICLAVAGYVTGRNVESQWEKCCEDDSDFEPLSKEESINERQAGDLVFLFRKKAKKDWIDKNPENPENYEPYHVAVASGKHSFYHSVLYPDWLPEKGIREDCPKNCTDKSHSQYPSLAAESYAVIRLKGHEKNSLKNQGKKLADPAKES